MADINGSLRMIAIGLLIIIMFVVAIDLVNYMLAPSQDILSVLFVAVMHVFVEALLLILLSFLRKSD